MAWTYINKAIVQKCWGGFLSHDNLIGTRFFSGLRIEHTPGRHRGSGGKSLTETGRKTGTSHIVMGAGGNGAVTPKESKHLCASCLSVMLLPSLFISIGPRKKNSLYSLPKEPRHKLDKKDTYNIDVFKSVSYFKQLFI